MTKYSNRKVRVAALPGVAPELTGVAKGEPDLGYVGVEIDAPANWAGQTITIDVRDVTVEGESAS